MAREAHTASRRQDASSPSPGASRGWLGRHPLVTSIGAAAGFLGVIQAAFQIWRMRGFGGPQMALGSAVFGMLTAVVTMVVLLPVILLARRLRPEWRAGDRAGATWVVAFALAAAAAASIAVREWVASPLFDPRVRPVVEILAVVAAFCAALWVRPPRRWIHVGAVATPVLVLLPLALMPLVGGGRGGGAGGDAGGDESVISQGRPADAPDVVLISIDTLRADRLRDWGGAPSLTPEMDRLADEGVVFTRALASSPWTVPSVASMITGVSALGHGAGRAATSGPTFFRSPLERRRTTLAERFAAAGYRTRAVIANGFLSADLGFDQGFERFANPFNDAMVAGVLADVPLIRAALALVPDDKLGDYRARGVTDRALSWLEEGADSPLFLWAHYIDPHSPFQADPDRLEPDALVGMMRQEQPAVLDDGTVVGEIFVATDLVRGGTLWLGPEDRRRLREYYDRAVSYTDEHVGRLVSALRQRSAGRPVVVAITSDHGEEFWEHGYFEHGHDYYREVTAIPLLFWGPGVVPAGVKVDSLAGLVDVAPTLLELAGLEAPSPETTADGRSLVGEWTGASGGRRPRFAGNNLYNLPAVLVEDGDWRFILRANGESELYDLARDPGERDDLSHARPEIAERYRELLAPRLAAWLQPGDGEEAAELSAETLRALKALGYVD